MKKIIILLICIFCAGRAFSQLEIYSQFNQNGKAVPDVNLYGEKKISSTLNLSYFTLVEQKWSEALVGVDYYPAKWINIGFMTGIEQNPALYRFYGTLGLAKDRTSLSLLFEKGHGSNNYWYKHTLSYKVSDQVMIAARAWRFNGIGPLAMYGIKKSDITLWTMPCYDTEFHQKRILLGFDIKL